MHLLSETNTHKCSVCFFLSDSELRTPIKAKLITAEQPTNLIPMRSPLERSHTFIWTFTLVFQSMDAYLLGDNRGHGDLQELLLQWDKGQQAGVEEAQQL